MRAPGRYQAIAPEPRRPPQSRPATVQITPCYRSLGLHKRHFADDCPMTRVQRFDHVGITVADLDVATAFFVGLGLEVEGRMFMQGEFVDTVIGIPDSRSEIVMLRSPDGGTGLEL